MDSNDEEAEEDVDYDEPSPEEEDDDESDVSIYDLLWFSRPPNIFDYQSVDMRIPSQVRLYNWIYNKILS